MMEISYSTRVKFGPFEADLRTHELWKGGTRLKLVGQPFDILALLVSRPGQLVTREELRAELWPDDTFVDFNHGLNAAVNKLRDALCDSAADPRYIETLTRRGYRFIAGVESLAAPGISVAPGQEREGQGVNRVAASVAQEDGPSDGSASVSIVAPAKISPAPRRPYFTRPVYAVLTIALAFGLWRLAILTKIIATKGDMVAETAKPDTLSPLTKLSDLNSDPAFSPDGTRVAFRRASFIPGNSGIWIQQVGGERLIQVTYDRDDQNPVWSPDGRMIAFSRVAGGRRAIREVSAAGGLYAVTGGHSRVLFQNDLVPDRENSETDHPRNHEQIDWSPDGKSIVFSAKGKRGFPAIFLLDLESAKARQITAPDVTEGDWGPVFSPDGNEIAFVRMHDIMLMPAEGGELRRLTPTPMRLCSAPGWAADGQSLIFAAASSGGDISLWRIPATGGPPTPIREAGNLVWNPAVSKRGFRLAFERFSYSRSIHQIDLQPPGQRARLLIASVNSENDDQSLSPDGRKLAFQSDRTGGMDIWVSDSNGQNSIQLTAIGTAGSPRWSPDGEEITFDVGVGRDWREPRSLFVVKAEGGAPRPLLQDRFSNNIPRWSRNGKWIYFASNRTGEWQVWKISESGGPLMQITRHGGFTALESPDGKYIYYSKHNLENPEIWRVPVAGGEEMPVSPSLRPLDWEAWTIVDRGIIFVHAGIEGFPLVSLYDFSTQTVTQLGELDNPPFTVTASRDGKSLIFDQPEQMDSHIMLLENFR